MMRARGRLIVTRSGVIWGQALLYASGGTFMLALAWFGSGDRWLGPMVAFCFVLLVGWIVGSGSVWVSRDGIRGGLPWRRRVAWDQLAELSYVAGTDLFAVRGDRTSQIVAVVPSYFWDSRTRTESRRVSVLNRVLAAAHQFGWQPSASPTDTST